MADCIWEGTGQCGHTLVLIVGESGGYPRWELSVEDSFSTVVAEFFGATSGQQFDCTADETGISVEAGHDDFDCEWGGSTCDILPV